MYTNSGATNPLFAPSANTASGVPPLMHAILNHYHSGHFCGSASLGCQEASKRRGADLKTPARLGEKVSRLFPRPFAIVL